MKQLKTTNTGNKKDKTMTVKSDIRDVRGASIRPTRAIPSKMDKAKDAKRQRRERIDYDESYDDEDMEMEEKITELIYLVNEQFDAFMGKMSEELVMARMGDGADEACVFDWNEAEQVLRKFICANSPEKQWNIILNYLNG